MLQMKHKKCGYLPGSHDVPRDHVTLLDPVPVHRGIRSRGGGGRMKARAFFQVFKAWNHGQIQRNHPKAALLKGIVA